MKRLILVLLILLTGCATLPPVDKYCGVPGEIQFTINVGFELEHKSCVHDLEAISWLITIAVWDKDCKILTTNLVSWWNGCVYQLYQLTDNNWDDILYIGRFKNLKQMEEFLEITMPMTEKSKMIGGVQIK